MLAGKVSTVRSLTVPTIITKQIGDSLLDLNSDFSLEIEGALRAGAIMPSTNYTSQFS